MNGSRTSVAAVVRVDHELGSADFDALLRAGELTNYVTVVSVWPTFEDAETEASRLGEINEEKRSSSFAQHSRFRGVLSPEA